jgi:hypothetical protein
LSIEQNTQKRYKKEGPKSKQNEETIKGVDQKGTSPNDYSNMPLTPNSQGAYQKARTPIRAFNLEEPMLILATHFNIEFACAHCNAIHTFCL